MKWLFLLFPATALLFAGCESAKSESGAVPQSAASMLNGLPLGIIGEVEAVYLEGFNTPLEARVDTGATTSSIDARNIRAFERDGKKWVSFQVVGRGEKVERSYELPVERVAAIKRHGAESIQRYTVMLTFRIGHLTLEREFTLADRSRFEYPVLLGRNVINGLAAVDPSRRNVL